MSRYWYVDFDQEAMEVYFEDAEDSWRLYGAMFSMNGDNVVIDFASCKRKKYTIADFDEGEQPSVFFEVDKYFTEQYAENESKWTKKYAEAESKIADFESSVATMETELAELRKFKLDAETDADKAAREGVFSQFEDLAGVEAFDELLNACDKYSLEELEEKCFAIRGRTNPTAKFTAQEPKVPKLMIEKPDGTDDEPYGGLFKKYNTGK
jgi:hypothetical protein